MIIRRAVGGILMPIYDDKQLKAINLFHLESQITISEKLISYTDFQPGQLLQTYIYGNMIMIVPAIPETEDLLY